MSWYGKHPEITREEARRMLPPGACKQCVYFARCFPKKVRENYDLMNCSRCSTYSGAFYLFDYFGVPMLVPRPDRASDRAGHQTIGARFKEKADRLGEDATQWT